MGMDILAEQQQEASNAQLEMLDFTEFALSGMTNFFLNEQTVTLKSHYIPWETFLKANMITKQELEAIKKYDNMALVTYNKVLQSDPAYLSTIVLFLQKIVRVDTVQYLLIMLDQAICDCLRLMISSAGSGGGISGSGTALTSNVLVSMSTVLRQSMYDALMRCLAKDDEFTQLKTAVIMTELALAWSEGEGKMPERPLMALLRWIFLQVASLKNNNATDIAFQALSSLLRSPHYRSVIYHYPNSIQILIEYLNKASPNPQTAYQIVLCFWLLTYLEEATEEMHSKFNMVSFIVDLCKKANKEKVNRICIMFLRSLIEKNPKVNMVPMVGNRVVIMCDTLLARKWADVDIIQDLDFLKSTLNEHINKLTTWDEYVSEVKSGSLDWTPVHTSEPFWKQNVSKLNENEREVLRLLARILVTSSDPKVLAVACHDLRQYIKHYSSGKRYIQELGAKQQLMELMTHNDPDVRYNALMAVQQYMSNAWQSTQ